MITQSINSVLAQIDTRWELIIVDDGSTDDTIDIVQPFLKDERFKYVYQCNQGVSAARNLGAKHAAGKYLIFLDSDDSFYPQLLSSLYEIDIDSYDLICWNILKVIDGKESNWKPKNLGGLYNGIKATFLAGSICYKKQIFIKAGGYDTNLKFGENYELGIRISRLKNLQIKILNESLMVYTIDTENRESNSLPNKLSSNIYQYKKHRKKYQNNRRAKAKMNYLLGYGLEKSNKKRAALDQYFNSWFTWPFNLKPMIKILYLKFFILRK